MTADLYTPSLNQTGMDNILIDLVGQVPAFIPLFLLFVFFVVFLGGIKLQKVRTGTADYPAWAVVASIMMFVMSLLLTLVSGLIRLEWLVIVIVVTIFCGVWLFLDKRMGEV